MDYVVVRETTLDGTDESDGFESVPRPTTIDDIFRFNEKAQRRQVQPTPTPTSFSLGDDDSDSEDEIDENAPTPVRTLAEHNTGGTNSSRFW